jgi:LacI family repressor for deo operon, udp, cdd, tsx, nupC, and nupG
VPSGLSEVAARAGVSKSTVSNVLHHTGRVSPGVQARVLAAIHELDYQPNLSARTLRGGLSGVIGLAVPDMSSPYFSAFAALVVSSAHGHGGKVLIEQTGGLPEREAAVVRALRGNFIDGLLLHPANQPLPDSTDLSAAGPIVLLVDKDYQGAIPRVYWDNTAAAWTAAQYLNSLGRRKLALLSDAEPDGTVASWRRAGCAQLLSAAADLGLDPDLVAYAALTRSGGAAAVRQLLSRGRPFDALLCFSEAQSAYGALSELARSGLRVPDDVAVVGVDDLDEGRYTHPPLTTVTLDLGAVTDAALGLLAQTITAWRTPQLAAPPPRSIFLAHALSIRGSTPQEQARRSR